MRYLYILLFSHAITACSPVFETQFTLQEPEMTSQKQCVLQCADLNKSCLVLAQQHLAVCEMNNQYKHIDRYSCLGINNHKPCHASPKACIDETGSCEDNFRACFKQCGGAITRESVCISNCD